MKLDTELVLEAVEDYATEYAIYQVVSRQAREGRRRSAAQAWARVAFLAGGRMVSLVKGFIPTERMACGCPPDQVMPHSSEAHRDRKEYDDRYFARLDEILAEYGR